MRISVVGSIVLFYANAAVRRPGVSDLPMVEAVEASIVDWNMGAPPASIGRILQRMGSPFYRERGRASKSLRGMCWADPRWLFWGAASRDLEVRVRCRGVLRSLYPCTQCRGTGRRYGYHAACALCDGTGSACSAALFD